MASDPKSPVRADHRFIKKLASSILGGKVDIRPAECDQAARVFKILNGSWERIFKGSSQDVHILKAVLKKMFKAGKLTQTADWELDKPDKVN